MDPLSWIAIGSVILSLLGNIWGSYKNSSDNKTILGQQQDFTRQMNAVQNQQGINQWERESEYNSIQSQMQRMSAAGLNPDLIYGQASSGSASAQLPSSFDSPDGGFNGLSGLSGIGNGLSSSVQSAVRMQNETDLAESQSDMYKSQANYYDYLSSGKGGVDASVAASNTASAEYKRRLARSQDIVDNLNVARTNETNQRISNLLGDYNNIVLKGKALNEDVIAKRIDNLYRDEHWQKQLRLLESQIGVNNTDSAYFRQQTRELIETFAYRLNVIRNDSSKSDVEKEDAASRALLDELMAAQQMEMFFERDKDGNLTPNGWNKFMTYATQVTGMLGNVLGGNYQMFNNVSTPHSSKTTTKYGMGEDGRMHPTSQTTVKKRKVFN